jgi:hypothetical protein
MKRKVDPTRRQFLWKASAALSAPFAAVGVNASAQASEDTAAIKARLERLEDVNEIFRLLREYAKRLNAGTNEEGELFTGHEPPPVPHACGLTLDPLEENAVEIGHAGTARVRVQCILETARPIESCPLVDMARAQGGGLDRRTERGVLESRCFKEQGTWKIKDLEFYHA